MKIKLTHRTKLTRRTVLRSSKVGIGVAVGLPLLEAMFDGDRAYAQYTTKEQNLLSLYLPNGIIEDHWFPKYTDKTTLNLAGSALEEFANKGLEGDISLYRGFTNACGIDTPSNGNVHVRAIASWLSGYAMPDVLVPSQNTSIDFLLTNKYSTAHRHPVNLSANIERESIFPRFAHHRLFNALSWDNNNQHNPPTTDLLRVYNRLFSLDTAAINTKSELELTSSVLDYIKQDAEQLKKQLGSDDRNTMERYFGNLRDVERSVKEQLNQVVQCNPDISSEKMPALEPGTRNQAIEAHAKAAAKLTALAFQCNLVSAVNYAFGGEQSNADYAELGIGLRFHTDVSDNLRYKKDAIKIDKFHADLAANFLYELKNTPHGEGSLLDSTAMIFGSGLGNAAKHETNNIAMLVAGKMGEWKHGRYHQASGVNHRWLINTIKRELNIQHSFGSEVVDIQ